MMAAEQKILLALLITALCATLALYILKAKKQVAYKGDERWELVQVRANNAANAVNLVLLALLIALPFVADGESTLTLNRVGTFGVLYIGLRNLIELGATVYWDRQL